MATSRELEQILLLSERFQAICEEGREATVEELTEVLWTSGVYKERLLERMQGKYTLEEIGDLLYGERGKKFLKAVIGIRKGMTELFEGVIEKIKDTTDGEVPEEILEEFGESIEAFIDQSVDELEGIFSE